MRTGPGHDKAQWAPLCILPFQVPPLIQREEINICEVKEADKEKRAETMQI